jgi:Na+-transporting NADH:ubiquinone oxidoreductase subunit D
MSNNVSISAKEFNEAMQNGILKENPIIYQVLGICSLLAVTNRLENAMIMGLALIFVTGMSNLIISMLRTLIPPRIRMIAEVAVIATFVIFFDQSLRAFYWDMSKQLGPYVGLIITNCIVMGRAEAFALQNPPLLSLFDGIANGIGYSLMLIAVAICRELAGTGNLVVFGLNVASLFNITSFTDVGYVNNLIFVLAPGAFFVAGIIIWIIGAIKMRNTTEEDKS